MSTIPPYTAANRGSIQKPAAQRRYIKGMPVALPIRTPEEAARERTNCLRFRTEACRTFVTEGVCPYDDKCMFAHGAKALRTKEQNEADELVTEVAIRAWMYRRRRQASRRAAVAEARRKAKADKYLTQQAEQKCPISAKEKQEQCCCSDADEDEEHLARVRSIRRFSNDTQNDGYVQNDLGVLSADDENLSPRDEDDDEIPVAYQPVDARASYTAAVAPDRRVEAIPVFVSAPIVFVRGTAGRYRRDPYRIITEPPS